MVSAQDDELSAIRARRLKAIQEQAQQQAITQMEAEEEAQKAAQTAVEIDAILRRALTPDARSRIAMVEPKRANAIKADLAAMLEQGTINTPLSDASLKQILAQLSKSRNNASVRRI